jgi:hypothetical protein
MSLLLSSIRLEIVAIGIPGANSSGETFRVRAEVRS